MPEFTLDTSGIICGVAAHGCTCDFDWSTLDPFPQGYIGAAFQSLRERLFWLECPSCEWDCIVGSPSIGDLGLTCPLCAGDHGRDVSLRTRSGDMPSTVEGPDARDMLRYDRLAPEALAAILRDCAAYLSTEWEVPGEGTTRALNTAQNGRLFWEGRQVGNFDGDGYPPLTPYLGDDGKVRGCGEA